jgi:hypothetical protein
MIIEIKDLPNGKEKRLYLTYVRYLKISYSNLECM